jgi:hypothetical protein
MLNIAKHTPMLVPSPIALRAIDNGVLTTKDKG